MNKYDENLIFYWKNGVRRCFRLNGNLDKAKIKRKTINGKVHYVKEKNKEKVSIKNITQDFIVNSTPNKGKMEFAENFDYAAHKDEIETACWLIKRFGGNIFLNQEDDSPQHAGKSNPDYVWNGKWWDLKEPTSENALDKRVHDGIHQICENKDYDAGGIIVDVSKMNMNKQEILEIISYRTKRSFIKNIKVIIKKEEELVEVLEIKK